MSSSNFDGSSQPAGSSDTAVPAAAASAPVGAPGGRTREISQCSVSRTHTPFVPAASFRATSFAFAHRKVASDACSHCFGVEVVTRSVENITQVLSEVSRQSDLTPNPSLLPLPPGEDILVKGDNTATSCNTTPAQISSDVDVAFVKTTSETQHDEQGKHIDDPVDRLNRSQPHSTANVAGTRSIPGQGASRIRASPSRLLRASLDSLKLLTKEALLDVVVRISREHEVLVRAVEDRLSEPCTCATVAIQETDDDAADFDAQRLESRSPSYAPLHSVPDSARSPRYSVSGGGGTATTDPSPSRPESPGDLVPRRSEALQHNSIGAPSSSQPASMSCAVATLLDAVANTKTRLVSLVEPLSGNATAPPSEVHDILSHTQRYRDSQFGGKVFTKAPKAAGTKRDSVETVGSQDELLSLASDSPRGLQIGGTSQGANAAGSNSQPSSARRQRQASLFAIALPLPVGGSETGTNDQHAVAGRPTRLLQARKSLLVSTHAETDTDEISGFDMVNQYLMMEEIGAGVSGVVYAVYDTTLSHDFAMKVIKRDRFQRRFSTFQTTGMAARPVDHTTNREVAIMKKLRHPHVVKLHEVIDDASHNKLYLVMQLLTGGRLCPSLDPATGECEPVEPQRLRKYVYQICDGLRYLHQHNIIHRDVKPENMMLDANDNVVLVDFGVSEVALDDEGLVEGAIGTPAFMAPEVWNGDRVCGAAADVWSLGVSVFMMLTGRSPFLAKTKDALIEQVRMRDPEFPEGVDPAWRALLRGMLSKNAATRVSLSAIMRTPMFASFRPGRKSAALFSDEFRSHPIVVTEDDVSSAINERADVQFVVDEFPLQQSQSCDANVLERDNGTTGPGSRSSVGAAVASAAEMPKESTSARSLRETSSVLPLRISGEMMLRAAAHHRSSIAVINAM